MKRLIIDIDNTICRSEGQRYSEAEPISAVRDRLHDYRKLGFEIVLHTSRNMRTFNGNVGRINAHTLPILITWLEAHNIPYDEIIVGKPWCGDFGFYVDDRAIRPDEFARFSYEELNSILDESARALLTVSGTSSQ